jgi:hypothetical protein
VVLFVATLARAESTAEAGRRVWRANQEAVVTIKLVLSQSVSFSGRDQNNESKTETVGTVIDPSGLTVISLSAIDPSNALRSMLTARMRGQASDLKVDSQVKDAKLVLADGTELAVEVALRDKDLDLAYLRPVEKQAKPFVAISLANPAQPQVLDEVICLNRLGKVANRVATVSIERIDALVDRPRPYYVIGQGGSSGVGSPVFAMSGAPLGIILMRNAATEGEGNITGMFSGGSALGIMPIIVPAQDILDDAKQAMEAPAKPVTTETPKETPKDK